MPKRPARVLFLNSRSEYGGADMGLLAIVRNLDGERFRPIVVLPHEGPLVADLRAAGAEIVYLDLCRLERLAGAGEAWLFVRRFVSSLRQLLRLIREREVDLVYTNSSAIQVGALAARLAGVPNVWHVREIWTEPRWLTGALYRYIYAFANRIIAISHAVAEANFGCAGDKIAVVRDGVDLARFEGAAARAGAMRARLGLPASWPLVTTVARMVPQKGLASVVEAARQVRDAGVDAGFCLAGDIPRPMYEGYREHLRELVARYDLGDRVRMPGWVDDAPALLAASDLFVLASIGPEGAGLVIPEAWLAGVPVVAADHSGPAEIVEHGHNGLLFEAGNAADLAEKLLTLLGDPALRRRLAEQGRRDALALHDAARNTAAIARIMEELL